MYTHTNVCICIYTYVIIPSYCAVVYILSINNYVYIYIELNLNTMRWCVVSRSSNDVSEEPAGRPTSAAVEGDADVSISGGGSTAVLAATC